MDQLNAILGSAGSAIREARRRRRRGCRLRLLGCLVMTGFVIALFILLAFVLFGTASAQEPLDVPERLVVQLLIDNSNSMFDKAGVGSDPHHIRLDAARLFVEYLGVDDDRFDPACGVIFFGTDAEIVAPLTNLGDASARDQLKALLADPERMGWTDQSKAIQLARQGLSDGASKRALVLLTDGKPEWSDYPTEADTQIYLEEMSRLGQQLGKDGIALYIVLLAGPATDEDTDIAEIWQPVWKDMTASSAGGQFFVVRHPDQLPAIYHDIILSLTGILSSGAVVDVTLDAEKLDETILVEEGIATLRLLIRKSDPNTTVTVELPSGRIVGTQDTVDEVPSRLGNWLEEVWTFDAPEPGAWRIIASGAGRLTVWKDYILATPTPMPTPEPTATRKPEPTVTPLPEATSTRAAAMALSQSPTVEASVPVESDLPADAPTGNHWGLALATMTALGGTVLLLAYLVHQRRRQPMLDGVIKLLSGSSKGSHSISSSSFDLYQLRRSSITIGGESADIKIPGMLTDLALSIRKQASGEVAVVATANPEVLLNGQKLMSDQPVYDGDTFVIDELRARYDNLQRRRPRGQHANRQSAGTTSRLQAR